ncbi:MAG TPA: tRNA (N6-isopentenyl adenosine(37)-C2)-methylthiotransferase MiaB [Ignavibacteriales bacterium]|nr:tRNA (N6-isopentenyl adenosine(37)-C2)-methylthiotransferase MiaB [Ignavibacteriales bacterium]
MNMNIYIETYGCQMNVADTELIKTILNRAGHKVVENPEDANIFFMNTCSIRENAENKIIHRLDNIKPIKQKKEQFIVGILGCMAEKVRDNFIKNYPIVDIVVGPDEYRNLPQYIDKALQGGKGIGVKLSRVETYDDIIPTRDNNLLAQISIMRGCDKFCSYCVVPFTRGRERSRNFDSIINEIKQLAEQGYKEVTLLGQNVNSYRFENKDFADLLEAAAVAAPKMRIRYTTSHPIDLSDKLLEVMAKYDNICKYLHLPVQSGSNRILQLMNREYTIEHYLRIIEKAKTLMPDIAISTDIIAGFCTETDEDHLATLNLMNAVKYDGAYMFKYSPRENTKAYKMVDDVPDIIKTRRLQEIIDLQQKHSLENNQKLVGQKQIILVEDFSKKSNNYVIGRTDNNKSTIVELNGNIKFGDLIEVEIEKVTSATLFGKYLKHVE